MLQSALYHGRVRHRRFAPRRREFEYRVFMAWLDLAELDRAFAGRWFWSTRRAAPVRFDRADYLGDPALPLDEAVRARVAEHAGRRPDGPIRMLTHLRHFGLAFNPVTFYYCFSADDTRVDAIVAEVTNTPWNERHAYVLDGRQAVATAGAPSPASAATPTDASAARALRYRFRKAFHVSPFLPMEMQYDWRFTAPVGRARAIGVHLEDWQDGRKALDATLVLRRREIGTRSLAHALAAFPFMTASVLGGIYWQALRLWLAGTPFHAHPTRATHAAATR